MENKQVPQQGIRTRSQKRSASRSGSAPKQLSKSREKKQKKKKHNSPDKKEEVKSDNPPKANQALDAADQAHSEKEPDVPAEEDQQPPSKEPEVPPHGHHQAHHDVANQAPSKEPDVPAEEQHQAHSQDHKVPADGHHQAALDEADKAQPDDAREAPNDAQVLPNTGQVPVYNQQGIQQNPFRAGAPEKEALDFLTDFLKESKLRNSLQNMNMRRDDSDENMHFSPQIDNENNLQHQEDDVDSVIFVEERVSQKRSVNDYLDSDKDEPEQLGSEESKGTNPKKRKIQQISGGVEQAHKQDNKQQRAQKQRSRQGAQSDQEMLDLSEQKSKHEDEDESFDIHKIPQFTDFEMKQLDLIKFHDMQNGLFSDVISWYFTDGTPYSQYFTEFDVDQVHLNENFLIANPIYLANLIDIGKYYKPQYVINGMDKQKRDDHMAELLLHIEGKGDPYIDALQLMSQMAQKSPENAFMWHICSMFRITYPRIKKSLAPALLEEYNIPRPKEKKNKLNTSLLTLRDVYSLIKSVVPKSTDYNNTEWSLFPGINHRRGPISFLEYLKDDDESISLNMFGANQLFSVHQKSNDILQIIAQFLKGILDLGDDDLKTVASIINNHQLMYIKLFRFFYQNLDLSPFRPNKIQEASQLSQFKTYVIYARLFYGLTKHYNKVTIGNLRTLRKMNSKAVFNITDQSNKETWAQNVLSQSQIVESLLSESSKPDGESLWGRGQLPYEAQKSKIVMFEVRSISLHHTIDINALSNQSVKYASNRARAAVIDQVPQEDIVEIPMKSLQKKIEINDKIKWFKTLLNHEDEVDNFKKEMSLLFLKRVVQAQEDQLNQIYIEASALVLLKDRGDGTFFGCMAHILNILDQENESQNILSLENEWEQRFGPLSQLYLDSIQKFEYIPPVFNTAIMKWISHSKSTNLQKQINHFIQNAIPVGSQRITYPFQWIKQLKDDQESIKSIIESNKIHPMLYKVCVTFCDIIIQKDLIYALSLLNENDRFAEWLIQQNLIIVNHLKELEKKNHQYFKQYAKFIDNAMQKEDPNFNKDSALIIEILENFINDKISLEQFNDTRSQDWQNHQIKILNGTLIDSFYDRVAAYITNKLSINFDDVLQLKSKKFSDKDFQNCIPKQTKIIATDSQALIAAYNAFIINNHGQLYKWILNGISAGCGKSVLITFIANHFAQQGKKVYVLACNKYLQTQLEHKFFNGTTHKGTIIITSPNSEDFLDFILGQRQNNIDTIKQSIIIVDEIDYFEDEERIIMNRGYSNQQNASRIYCFDILQALGEFQNVITFSSEVTLSLKKSLRELNTDNRVLDLDFGGIKGSGKESYIEPQWIKRRNLHRNSYLDETFEQIKKIIKEEGPKCLYVIMNYQDQVKILRNLLDGEVGQRLILTLDDLENAEQSSQIVSIAMDVIQYESGFVFITHSQANRGVDIQGVEPATVISNYRFSSGSDLHQALSRGNRSFNSKFQSKTYVFVDEIPSNISISKIQGQTTQIKLTENVQFEKFCKVFHGIQIDCPATNAEKEDMINLIKSFKHELNAIVGNGDQLTFKTLLQIYINLNDKTEELIMTDNKQKKFIVNIDQNDSQDVQDLKQFAKSISSSKFEMYNEFIQYTNLNIGKSNFMMIFLLRGICCAFPIFSQSASYMTQKALSLLCESLQQSKAIRRHSQFRATSGDVNVDQFIKELKDVQTINSKYFDY